LPKPAGEQTQVAFVLSAWALRTACLACSSRSAVEPSFAPFDIQSNFGRCSCSEAVAGVPASDIKTAAPMMQKDHFVDMQRHPIVSDRAMPAYEQWIKTQ
jgi:hypothetical protein